MEISQMVALRDVDDADLVSGVSTFVERPLQPRLSWTQAIVRHSLHPLRNLAPPAVHDRMLRAGREVVHDPSFHLQRRLHVPQCVRPGATRYLYPPGAPVPRDAVAVWTNESDFRRRPPCVVIVRPMVWALQCARVNTFPDTRTPTNGPTVDPATGLRCISMITQPLPFPTCVEPLARFLCLPDHRLLIATLLYASPPAGVTIDVCVPWAQQRFEGMGMDVVASRLRVAMGVYANAKYLQLTSSEFWQGLAEAWTRILVQLGRI